VQQVSIFHLQSHITEIVCAEKEEQWQAQQEQGLKVKEVQKGQAR